MREWVSKIGFSKQFRATVEPVLPLAALLLIACLPQTGHCGGIDFGQGLRPIASRAIGFASSPALGSLVERNEVFRNQGYARLVWLPSGTQIGGQHVRFGMASLTPIFRTAMSDSDGSRTSVVPVLWLPLRHDASLAVISKPSGSTKAMVTLQLKIGR